MMIVRNILNIWCRHNGNLTILCLGLFILKCSKTALNQPMPYKKYIKQQPYTRYFA